MRRVVALLFVAGAAVAVAAPTAATPEHSDRRTVARHGAAFAVQQMEVSLPGLRDEAAMVLVGTALIGLGAAVRRAA